MRSDKDIEEAIERVRMKFKILAFLTFTAITVNLIVYLVIGFTTNFKDNYLLHFTLSLIAIVIVSKIIAERLIKGAKKI